MNPPSRHATSSPDLVVQLHLEWRRLRRNPAHLMRAAGWSIATGPLVDLDEVLAAVGFATHRSPAHDAPARTTPASNTPDRSPSDHNTPVHSTPVLNAPGHEEALRRLVAIARHDDLAARTVVQRLLPGSLSVVRRHLQRGGHPDASAEMIGALWIAVRTFNPERRPGCIAAALIADAEYLAFKRAKRQRSASERPTDFPLDVAQPERHPHAWEELHELMQQATEAQATDADDLAFLKCLLDTPRTADIARTLNLSQRTVRNRRNRVAQRLREHVAA